MARYAETRQDVVQSRLQRLEQGGGIKSIHEQRGAAGAGWRMRQEVKDLQAGGIGEVCRIGMSGKALGAVGEVAV